MAVDFYLDDFARAAYFEKDWFDHVIASGSARPGRFAFAPFDFARIYSPYHEHFAGLIAGAGGRPSHYLEIGSSTGRTFFEVLRRTPSLARATLLEPSAFLRGIHDKLSQPGRAAEYFPVLKGNGELAEVLMKVSEIRDVFARVATRKLDVAFGDAPTDLGEHDLVVCSNVIDQCHEPLRLVDLLKRSVAPGGLLAVSCTYQWQSKYRGLPTEPIRHLDQLFDAAWALVAEADIPFQLRTNERHWMSFLSHACVFRKL